MSEFLDTSEWVPIHTLPTFESAIEYYVNKNGQILSTKGGKERLLKIQTSANGYQTVSLQQRIGQKKPIVVHIHKLVAFAFLPPPPKPYGAKKGCCIIDHIDDDKSNNCSDNLRWVTHQENMCKKPYKKFKKIYTTPEDLILKKERKRERDRLRYQKQKAAKIDKDSPEISSNG